MDGIDLHGLLTGALPGPVRVCRIDRTAAVAIGAKTQDVWLSKEDAEKIKAKHGLDLRHLHLVPIAARYGWAGVEPHRPRHLIIVYEDREVFGRFFKLVIKATGNGREMYIETFHRSHLGQLRSLIRRSKVIRQQERAEQTVPPFGVSGGDSLA